MSFTLVVTSYGRDADLNRLFGSIARQTFRGRINIAFVNQGFMTPPSRAALPTSIGFAETRTDGRVSVSRARNIGLRDQSAAIIAFPDDDCWYETNLLDNVANYFRDNPTIDCICTNVYDPVRQSVYGKRPMGVIRRVSFANLFRLGISVGIFVRREALELAGGYFDERLGAGTPNRFRRGDGVPGSPIEPGLPHRICRRSSGLSSGASLLERRCPQELSVWCGFRHVNGRFLRAGHPGVLWGFVEMFARSFLGTVVYLLDPVRRAVYWNRMRGILSGFLSVAAE